LFVYIANFQCTGEYVNCGGSSPSKMCVHQYYLCDGGSRICGNGWEQLKKTCGQFVYWLICWLFINYFALRTVYLYLLVDFMVFVTTTILGAWEFY